MKKGAYNLVKQSRFSPEPTSEGAGHHQGRCLRVWVQPALQAVQKCRSQNRRGKRGSVRRSTEEEGGGGKSRKNRKDHRRAWGCFQQEARWWRETAELGRAEEQGEWGRTSDPAEPGAALDVLRACDHPPAGRGWAVTATKWGDGLIKNMPVKSSSVQGYSGWIIQQPISICYGVTSSEWKRKFLQ